MARTPKTSNTNQPVLPAPEFRPPACWPQVQAAAKEYAGWRDKRKQCGNEAKAAYDRLQELLKFHDVKFDGGVIEYDGLRLEKRAEVKIKVRIEDEPFEESDPNEVPLDGTVHPEDEDDDEPNPGLARDLRVIQAANEERLAAADDEAA